MRNVVVVLAVLAFLTACGPKRVTLAEKVRSGKTSIAEVYTEANKLMYKRKYLEARQWYRVLEAQAPDSPYFSDTKLRIADSYFFDRTSTYIEASVEYKSFLTHFPTHAKADYAQYQYAMCFFTEIENPERDQTSTWTAYTEFKNLLDKYPGSPYARKAQQKIDLCMLRLADHEFTVGYYYYRRGRGFEKSAESRLKYIIDNYEGQYDPIKIYYYLAETLWRQRKYKEAIRYFNYIDERGRDTEYYPFVLDKLARYEQIEQGEEDPGEISQEIPIDTIEDQ